MTSFQSNVVEECVVEFSSYYQIRHEWKVKNFTSVKEQIFSPEFEVQLFGESTEWKISLSHHYSTENGVYCSVFLHLVRTKLSNILLDCEFTFMNSERIKIKERGFSKRELKEGCNSGFVCFIERDILLRNISNDNNLLITSKIVVSNSREPIPKCIVPDMKNLDEIRESGDISDIIFSVQDIKFPAHKNILAARSPVFAAMFRTEMKEAKSGEVEIKDMEPEDFEAFLKCVYSSYNLINKEKAARLLAAADKYDIEELKDFCQNILCKTLTHENCIRTLILADLHTAEALKRKTIDFIVSEDLKLDREMLMEINDVALLKEILEALSKR